MGHGPKNGIMAIGEAPGKQEDESGLPFQGKSGQLLDSLLDDNGIKRKDVYVTNAVKCRPPDNDKPSASQLKACKPFLEWEIARVKPSHMLVLGATSLKSLKRGAKVTEIRGQPMEIDGIPAMATYHPAMALRDPARLGPLKRDVEKFAQFVDNSLPETKEVKYTAIRSYLDWEKFIEAFTASEVFVFDVETTGLKWFLDDEHVNTIQFALDDSVWTLPLQARDSFIRGRHGLQKLMLQILKELSKGKQCAAHNGKFDNLWLIEKYDVRFHLTFDTMLASHTLDENRSHELKQLAPDELGAPNYDIPLRIKQGNWKSEDERILYYDYGAADAYWEKQLYHKFRGQLLRDSSLRRLFNRVVMRSARMFEEVETNGLYLNLDRKANVRKKLVAQQNRVLSDLNRMAKREVNWKSPDQVAKLLFEDLGLEILDKTPGGKPSTDESVLLRLKDKHPVAEKLLEFRGLDKNLSTYIDGWDKLRVGPVLHLSTKLHGTVTGRYSSRLHQVPRDPLIRSIVDAPDPFIFGSADYSQIELRLVAHASGDMRMKTVFQSGGDIHATTASEVTGKDPDKLTKEERKQAKPVNFGFVYGMWWKKFLIYARDNYGVVFTPTEAQYYRRRFFEIYAGLEPWHERVRKVVRAFGEVVSLSGRKRRLPGAFSPDDLVRQEAERQGINSPIQGFGSGDMKAMAMVELHDKFSSREFVAELCTSTVGANGANLLDFPCRADGRPDIFRIVGEVHDSILFWVHRKYARVVLPGLKTIMERPELFDEFKIDLDVPIVADIELGPWGSPVAFYKKGRLVAEDGTPWTG